MITLFTTPKAFEGLIAVIQRNAIESWTHLHPEVQILLIGDEAGMAQTAFDLKVTHVPEVARNAHGTPLISDIFAQAQARARHARLCYLNADILLLDDFLPAVQRVAERFKRFLIVGRRWDLDIEARLDFAPGWVARLRKVLSSQGRLHPPAGSDYFVYPREVFETLPDFALGRAGWDNWMIYAGRARGLPVVDASAAATIVHQNHDYAHLPGGQPHYRLDESDENVRLAGGRHAIFTLQDADWILDGDTLRRKPLWASGLGRGLEAALISALGPGSPARWTWLLLHPRVGLSALRRRLAGRSS